MLAAVLSALLFAAARSSVIKEYHFVPQQMIWEDARRHCEENFGDLHADLAYVDSEADYQALLAAAGGATFELAWIGLHREMGNDTGWKWSGRPGEITYAHWYAGEPNNNGGIENKVVMRKSHTQWHDTPDQGAYPFFCVRVFSVREANKSWEEALQHCRDAGSDLASLNDHGSNPTGHRMWVGLRFLTDSWLWLSGHPSGYRAWAEATTTAAVANRATRDDQCPATVRCAVLKPTGGWEAQDCLERQSFLCRRPIW